MPGRRRKATIAATIVATGAICAMTLAACTPRPLPAERAALEKQLAIAMAGAKKDGSPAFYHDAEKDAKRLLLLDHDQKYYEKTVEHLKDLVEISQKTAHPAEAKRYIAELHHWEEWNTQRSLGQEASAERHYEVAAEHFKKGIASAKRLDKAIFGKYIKNLMVDYGDLAYVLQKQGHNKEAEKLHKEVLAATIQEEGKDSEAAQSVRLNLSHFYRETNQHQKALADLNEVISQHPHNLAARQQRAEVNSALGSHKAAVADLTVALNENPEAWPLYLLRAHEYNVTGEHAKAIEDANMAIGQKPLALSARARRVEAYLALQRHKEALAELGEILKVTPHDAWAKGKHKEVSDKVAAKK